MTERDPFKLAEKLEREAEELERRSQDVQSAVHETREDWKRKRADAAVPGAKAPDEDEDAERSA